MPLTLDSLMSHASPVNSILFVVCLLVTYTALKGFYNIYLHPLSKYPGPKWCAATKIPIAYFSWIGRISHWLLDLHEQFDSDVVRVSPDELSFISPSAWKDIYGTRQGSINPFAKDAILHTGIDSIVSANDADHSRMRRLLSHAFSDKALREQEPLIQVHVDDLMTGLKQHINGSEGKADLSKWLNWTTFDIIGDLAFGESFDCVKETTYQPWVTMLMGLLRFTIMNGVALRFPPLHNVAAKFIPKSVIQQHTDHRRMSKEKVQRRLESNTTRPDFMSYILRHMGTKAGMSEDEIALNAATFIAAGSETTATLLAGAVWSLLHNPANMARLQNEIRSRFSRAEDIKLQNTDGLEYLHAVVSESFRMYPPGVSGQPRRAPPSGDFVSGYWVPPNIHQYAAFMSQRNFLSPSVFAPSRWLGDPKYASDKRDVLQPFSVGTRSCIGKNLANAEIALVLTRLLWEFDLYLAEETDENWADQKAWMTWVKKPLVVTVKVRQAA
ncbi:MAG: hypothetical protein Q9222_007658 [Ikaeria aurantiellina]